MYTGWEGQRADRVVEGAAKQHDNNERLLARALEAGGAGEKLKVSVSDVMRALSHVSLSQTSIALHKQAPNSSTQPRGRNGGALD